MRYEILKIKVFEIYISYIHNKQEKMTLLYDLAIESLSTIVVIGFLKNIFRYIFEVYDCGYYKKYTDSKVRTGSLTIQWSIVSMIVSMFMGFTSLSKFFPVLPNIIMFDNDYDIYSSVDTVSVFVAYVMYDLIFNRPPKTYIFHHVLCLMPIVIFTIYEYSYGMMVGEILLIAEISTIFLSMKSFIKYITESNMKIVNILFVATFVTFRTLMMPYILLSLYFKVNTEPTIDNILGMYTFISVFILTILNMIWSYVICKKILSSNK